MGLLLSLLFCVYRVWIAETALIGIIYMTTSVTGSATHQTLGPGLGIVPPAKSILLLVFLRELSH
jgi:hypothetical protein